jgi:hypothetical protein
MSEEPDERPGEGPGTGGILLGSFIVLFGLCLALLGGGCTVILLADMRNVAAYGGWFFLVVALAILAAGLALIRLGVKLARGDYRK